MSKQESNQTKRNLLRRGLAGILLLAMLFGLLPSTVFTAHAASWADPYCQTLVDWGVMRGDINGNLAPDRSITRAEFVTMMNRAYGYTKLGGNPFTDVRVTDWYYEDIDIGYNIGYFKGTAPTKASPNDTLTREQAAVLLARNMMLQETVGETLGFSDSRTLSEWSRGLVGAAAASGIISGYDDGSFQPFKNITRGEVAAMLVRAIGTPINTEGEHALGNVYGNVTVNTSGVKLRDGVIVGNLYLTGGIDLGEVLLENVTVLGEIIVSGGGESNSSASSIIMRNVVADGMIVDSISDQFVTIRAEGNTDIPTTTVRTNAYVDDSSLPGYGLSHITLDGDEGALLQLAGNIKDVVNKTPGSDLQVVQGVADKITVDENATGSSVLVDGDARVDDLNLDTATTVTGTGDIGNLNVGAAGSTVEQLPDNITIRPGITTDINGSTMNSTQAAESSSDPKLLAGYPAVKQIAPTSATLVFKTNKTGTVYWAVSAVADGSVKEEDLLEPPVYGGNVLQHGTITATAANTDYTAAVTGLTKDGSYYVTAMLVDNRGEHSPIKVTSFSTPDDTVPAFNQGYPYMSRITTENAQVTVSTNKSCLLYYALLPKGSTAPTPAEFKANAVSGNLGYGTVDTVKNVTQPFQVNSTRLKELTEYTLYLWLTDYDGAKSSAVTALNFTTPDETAPVIVSADPLAGNNSVDVTFVINEAATLYWAVVPEGMYEEVKFEGIDDNEWLPAPDVTNPDDAKLQIKIENGAGNSISNGNARVNAGYVNGKAQVRNLDPTVYGTSTFTMYMVAKDAAGNYSKVQKLTIRVKDNTPPTVTLEFDPANENNPSQPTISATAQLVFSEKVKGTGSGEDFQTLYNKVTTTVGNEKADAINAWAAAVSKYITLYYGGASGTRPDTNPVKPVVTECRYDENGRRFIYGSVVDGAFKESDDWLVNYCAAELDVDRDNHMIIKFPAYNDETKAGALKLTSGTQYHFTVEDVVDTSEEANTLRPNPTRMEFTVSPAKVDLDLSGESERPPVIKTAKLKDTGTGENKVTGKTIFTAADITNPPTTDNVKGHETDFPADIQQTHTYWDKNLPQRIDRAITMIPDFSKDAVDDKTFYDILIWSNKGMDITIYSRPLDKDGNVQPNLPWEWEGVMEFRGTGNDGKTSIFHSMNTMYRNQDGTYQAPYLKDMVPREYAFHVDRLGQLGNYDSPQNTWDDAIDLRISVVAGDEYMLNQLSLETSAAKYNEYVPSRLSSIGDADPFEREIRFTAKGAPTITRVDVTEISATDADFGFIMDAYGKVKYAVFQLNNIKYKDTDTGPVKIHQGSSDPTAVSSIINKIYGSETEPRYGAGTLIRTADGAYPPLAKMVNLETAAGGTGTPLLDPVPEAVIDESWANDATVRMGETDYVMGGNPAKPKNLANFLKPNNAYIIIVVPMGRGDVYDKTAAQAYYFTTPKASPPILTFTSNSGAAITAYVDRTATVYSKLLIQDSIKGADDVRVQMLEETFGGNYTNAMWDTFIGSLSGDLKKRYEGYTVLDALYDSYRNDATLQGPAGDYPSFFDVFADDTARGDLYNLLSNPAYGGVIKGFSPATDIEVRQLGVKGNKPLNFTLDGELRRSVNYVCIGVAEGGTADARSFRATPNISIGRDDGPHITGVDVSSLKYDEENQTLSGSVIISYDRTLYRVGTLGPKPATQANGGTASLIDGKYYGLDAVLLTTTFFTIHDDGDNYGEITDIILDATGTGTTPNGDVTINLRGLADSSPKVLNARFTLHYDKETGAYKELDVSTEVIYTDP